MQSENPVVRPSRAELPRGVRTGRQGKEGNEVGGCYGSPEKTTFSAKPIAAGPRAAAGEAKPSLGTQAWGDSYSTPSSPEGPIPSSPAQPGLCNTHPAPPPRWRLPHRPPTPRALPPRAPRPRELRGLWNKARGADRPGRGRRPCWRGRRTKARGPSLRPPPAARPAGGAVQAPPAARTMRRGPLLPGRHRPSAGPARGPLAASAPQRRTGLTCRPPRPPSAARGPHCPEPRSRPGPTEPDGAAPPPLRSAAAAARPRPQGARALRPPTAPAAPPGPGPTGHSAQALQSVGGALRWWAGHDGGIGRGLAMRQDLTRLTWLREGTEWGRA
ncbi:proline-rich protein HaeIII subfamily 1-like [Sus scrofa]|uniref:proline-rich protein HaeIII subfamily 1-like n=1 Tax=Sus scrofa TaxID=9823 RepID=UPI000A2B59B9|nr:proline-rich protein HaeIII subfamily 1-like [Sus scrofa]